MHDALLVNELERVAEVGSPVHDIRFAETAGPASRRLKTLLQQVVTPCP